MQSINGASALNVELRIEGFLQSITHLSQGPPGASQQCGQWLVVGSDYMWFWGSSVATFSVTVGKSLSTSVTQYVNMQKY